MKPVLLLSGLLLALAGSASHAAEIPLSVEKNTSRIEYSVTATLDTFTGTLTAYDLDLAADPAARAPVSRAELRFRFSDLRSNHDKRDAEMRHWQNTEQFPECVFTLTALEPTDIAGRFTARGQFIFHGTSRDLVFPISLEKADAGLLRIDAQIRIDTRDFGLPSIRRYALFRVDPVVTVKLHLEARPMPARHPPKVSRIE